MFRADTINDMEGHKKLIRLLTQHGAEYKGRASVMKFKYTSVKSIIIIMIIYI